jgi:hypothetical protein
MEHQRLQYLIKQYLEKQGTAQELAELNEWYRSIDYGCSDFDQWVKEVNGEQELASQLYMRFNNKLEENKRIVYPAKIYKIAGFAASIIAIISVLFIIYNNHKVNLVAKNTIQKPVVPGRNTAILTLANGSKIVLDDEKSGKIAKQSNVVISKNAQGKVVYKIISGEAKNNDVLAYNSIQTPRGGQYQVQLPDGTQVWLNAASSLKYPVHFAKTERRVELTGEAYFEVVHNANVPFKVISNNQEIKVLGTHFDVKAYSDDDAVSTTLLQGSVLIHNLAMNKSQLLIPGQQANLTQTSMQVSQVNTKQVISWKKGYFLFANMDIRNIMKLLSRWYDVDVHYQDIDQRETFGGTFSEHSDLKQILQNLQQLGHVHFRMEGHKVIVNK